MAVPKRRVAFSQPRNSLVAGPPGDAQGTDDAPEAAGASSIWAVATKEGLPSAQGEDPDANGGLAKASELVTARGGSSNQD